MKEKNYLPKRFKPGSETLVSGFAVRAEGP
jgi:hypothetical protein